MSRNLAADEYSGSSSSRLHVPVISGLGRRSAALVGRLEGWRVASKRLGALPRNRRGALGRGCGRSGRGALPLPRAAAVSTGLRVPFPRYAHMGLAAAPPAAGALALALL